MDSCRESECILIKKLKEENEQLSVKVIKDHVITLHREIKSIREQGIEGLKTVVETAVDTSVKKSYSEAATSAASATTSSASTLDSRVMRKVFPGRHRGRQEGKKCCSVWTLGDCRGGH